MTAVLKEVIILNFPSFFLEIVSNVASVQRVSWFATSVFHMSSVQISVKPQEALVDEKVHIRVDGLPKNGPFTIKASVQEGKLRFSSYGCYTATEEGHVVIEEQSASEGTYTGLYFIASAASSIKDNAYAYRGNPGELHRV